MPGVALEQFSALVLRANDAAAGLGEWNDFVCDLQRGFGVDIASLEVLDLQTGKARTAISEHLDDRAVREYEERIFALNPRIHIPDPQLHKVYSNGDIPPEIDATAGEYYDWIDRHRICPWYAGGPAVLDRNGFAVCAIQTQGPRGPVDDELKRALHLLLPHIGNALHIERTLGGALGGAANLDHRLDKAVALLDATGRIFFASDRFYRAIERSGALGYAGNRLVARTAGDRARLDALLTMGLRPGNIAAPRALRLVGPGSEKGLLLRVAPLAHQDRFIGLIRPRAIMTLTDLDAALSIALEDVQAAWGLTYRETQIAVRIAQGDTIDQAARRLAISAGTVRHHLKSIFSKMAVERQGDIVRFLTRFAT